jgi:hypothetical protein
VPQSVHETGNFRNQMTFDVRWFFSGSNRSKKGSRISEFPDSSCDTQNYKTRYDPDTRKRRLCYGRLSRGGRCRGCIREGNCRSKNRRYRCDSGTFALSYGKCCRGNNVLRYSRNFHKILVCLIRRGIHVKRPGIVAVCPRPDGYGTGRSGKFAAL